VPIVASISDGKSVILGITGPIACGKSTVARMAVERGAIEHIDADRVTHELMRPGTRLTERVAAEFGPGILTTNQGIDRRALGSAVFGHPERLEALERLVHPEVRAAILARLDQVRGEGRAGVVVIEAIKLLSSPLAELTDAVWFIQCGTEQQRERLRTERGLAGSDAEIRIGARPEFDLSKVTTAIDNNGSQVDLARKVDREWNKLTS
jgi:dephospho-CoA kinase